MLKINSEYDTDKDIPSASDSRRDLRKSIERGLLDNQPDKVQMNDIMLALLVIVAAAISFTDFTLSWGNVRNLTALTAFLYIITSLVYRNRYAKGKQRGRCDKDYTEALSVYREKRQALYDGSLVQHIPDFCKSYKVKELREYRENLLSDIDMEYSEYRETYHNKPTSFIMKQQLSWSVKRTLIKCNRAKPLKLTPGIIINENGEADRKKLVGQSGREREVIDKRKQIIERAIVVLFGSLVAINIIFDFSVLTIIQWLVRMIPVLSAIMMGDDSGYCNITVTETNFKRDQCTIISMFNDYINNTDIVEKNTNEDNTETCRSDRG